LRKSDVKKKSTSTRCLCCDPRGPLLRLGAAGDSRLSVMIRDAASEDVTDDLFHRRKSGSEELVAILLKSRQLCLNLNFFTERQLVEGRGPRHRPEINRIECLDRLWGFIMIGYRSLINRGVIVVVDYGRGRSSRQSHRSMNCLASRAENSV
jgi:hypothetical protein